MHRARTFLTPRRFCLFAGSFLILLASAGLIGVLGSISNASFFHPPYWINWVHLTIGLVLLGFVRFGSAKLQAGLVLFPAVIGSTIGLFGLIFGDFAAKRLGIPALADPSDHLAHLTVAAAAWWAWSKRERHNSHET